jgi:nicotinate-nucleotide pyrophosphorylase (carboxylating)
MKSIPDLDWFIDHWLNEDINEGDYTTLCTVPEDTKGSAVLLVKQAGVIAGISVAERIMKRFDSTLEWESRLKDGGTVSVGALVFSVRGRIRSILHCERLVLNVMQRMSGIATTTREYVDLIDGTGATILDTRKTTPGFRFLEKEAVRLGGGGNHRFGLYDMILIKDNHVDYAGGIINAVLSTHKYLADHKLDLKIEIETRSLDDVKSVLEIGGVDRIMLDNFTPELTRKAVELIGGRVETESSGRITRENIRDYAESGVNYISVGALTHQIKSLDLSLKALK